MKTTLFENAKNPNVIGYESINNILDKIINGYTRETVANARVAGKGSKLFEKLKLSTPTWTPNASFENQRKKSNIKNITGFIYLDVDEAVNVSLLKSIPFIYAFWKSFSAKGYGLLVQVDNIDLFNYQTVWTYLEKYFLDLEIVIDPQAKDITRQNVISYDPNLYQNPECNPLRADHIVCNKTSTSNLFNWDASDFNYPDFLFRSDTGLLSNRAYKFDSTLIYKTILEDYDGKTHIIFEEGKGYRDCYLPKSVEDGKRHLWLAGRIISLLFNNPDITYENLLHNTLYVNKRHMNPPKPQKEVIDLVKHLYDQHIYRMLNYNPKMKKIWINPNSDLTTTQKKMIIGSETGKLRRKKTLSHLQDRYDELKIHYSKVTQKMLADNSEKSLRTVKDYWHQIGK